MLQPAYWRSNRANRTYPQTWAWDLHEVVFDCGVLLRSFSDQKFLIDIEMHDYKHRLLTHSG